VRSSLASRPRAGGESGDTLIEVLVALVIMGAAFAVIVGGVGTAIIGAGIQQNKATADSLIRSAADKVTSLAYVPCATPVYPAPAGYALEPPPPGFTVRVFSVSYWDPVTNKFINPPVCTNATDNGLQLITLHASATSTDVHTAETAVLEVVKRQP
jgi:type II secretory pathway pseudopilin PulG